MRNKKKAVAELPAKGDRVELRGRSVQGVVVKVDEQSKWSSVEWDIKSAGPKIVHLNELQKITASPADDRD